MSHSPKAINTGLAKKAGLGYLKFVTPVHDYVERQYIYQIV